MLEGQTGRPLARRLSTLPVALWYGCAGVLAFALVGTLAWLARDTGPREPVEPALASRSAAAPTPVTPPAATDTLVRAHPAPPAEVEVAAAEPEPPVAFDAAPADEPARGRMQSAQPTPRPPLPVHPTVAARPPAPHPAARTVVAAHPAAPAPHARRPTPGARAKPAATEVDTDVALITAIIQHVPSRPPAPAGGCADQPCGQALPDQP